MADALYEPHADHFHSTELTRGPWSPDAQHGGPPAALLAFCVEHHAGSTDTQVVRMTVELLRPVPLAPLAVTLRTHRPGKKVQLLEATLRAGDGEVARATALRIRVADQPLPRTHGGSRRRPGPRAAPRACPR